MTRIKQITRDIISREGGFVNDPDDPGGATKFGVTLGTLRRLGIDLTGDGEIDQTDVKALSRAQAERIFMRHYFETPRIGTLPEALQASVYDMYVNAGSRAVRILQRLLRTLGHDLAVDGAIGPHTARAAHIAFKRGGPTLVDAYGIARRNYYLRLADQRPPLRKFARTRAGGKGGWILRAESFVRPHYRMSDEAFAARVAQWG